MSRRQRLIVGALAVGFLAGVGVAPVGADVTERVSVASDGTEANGPSAWGSPSVDGRIVSFESRATNLVPGDTNGDWDVFVRDRQTGVTERVSVASDGTEANGPSSWGSLSADGRIVAFRSRASNLVVGDTNRAFDIFVHDRQTGGTERVSVASDGTQANNFSGLPALSANGRIVAFASRAGNLGGAGYLGASYLAVHDRQTGVTERVNVPLFGTEENYPLSADGRVLAVQSYPPLVPGDTNGFRDVFVHDRQTGASERVSVDSLGTQGNGESFSAALSADGRVVAFQSRATNLVPSDTNGADDVFVRVRTGTPTIITSATAGSPDITTTQLLPPRRARPAPMARATRPAGETSPAAARRSARGLAGRPAGGGASRRRSGRSPTS